MTRILLVDDEPFLVARMSSLLRLHKRDWVTVTALDAEDALQRLTTEGPFDVIVSDIHMPGPDGEMLLKYVKDAHPGVGRIALTGDTASDKSARVATLSDRFLLKPFDSDGLEDAIVSVLKERQASSSV